MARTPRRPQADEAEGQDEPDVLAATPHNVTSANAGTNLVTGAGSITGITLAALPTSTDKTQLSLLDAGASGVGPTLFAADLQTLINFLVEPRPGVGLTPGMTAPTWPKTIAGTIPFTNGLYVKSCLTGPTFVVTA